ncbi:XVIPCD domain-containing protein [Stenotrophomonas rhizophila]|uniref:XVIPCD domain-containing protein n=1 Tax=Stenotrophomonas rhizophila TaxID=216778 RepID=UPI0021B2EE46|nr:XVIPCD domain-containing protein [Stenotrophomonas rhizophila]
MYLAVEHGDWSRSYGFAPARHGASSGPGAVTYEDVVEYQDPYYARTMEISKEQFDRIVSFGEDAAAHGFKMEYSGLSNSCIDFTWGALNHAGLHRQVKSQQDANFEGALKPLDNKSEIQSIRAPYPHSELNSEVHHAMPKRSLMQRLISENGEYEGVGRDPMMSQIREKVAELDAANGRSFDSTSERLSASLYVLAKENGLSRVDHVMLSERTTHASAAENIFVVQGERNDPAHLRASMPTTQAAQTPLEASLERGEQLANDSKLTQQLAAQAEQTQSQEREAAVRQMG